MPPRESAPSAQTASRSGAVTTRPPGSLQAQLQSLFRDGSTLARQELKLVRLELGEKAALLARGAAVLVAASTLLVVGLVHLSNAAQVWLSARIAPVLAALLLGGAMVAAGAALVIVARQFVEPRRLALHRTLHSLQREQGFAREHLP